MNESELLFSQVLNCDRLALYLNKDNYLEKDKIAFISSALKRRIKGEPIQYILGRTEFMGLELKVNKDVLIPRPETEILVETALSYLKRDTQQSKAGTPNKLIGRVSPKVLDLGTGSGCIAISLAKHLANLRIDASDISAQALDLAKENAALNNVNINFIQSDLFTSDKLKVASYDIIVSNPPYITRGEIKELQLELQYEPNLALNGGDDGLDFYRRIIPVAPDYLKKCGFLFLEIGFNQKQAVEEIFKAAGTLIIEESVKDYNNIDRLIVARKVDKNG